MDIDALAILLPLIGRVAVTVLAVGTLAVLAHGVATVFFSRH